MTNFSALLAAGALATALAGAASAEVGHDHAQAQHGPGGPGLRVDFSAIDADGDGSLSRPELIAFATARISSFDLDGDGALDRAEIVASLPARGEMIAVFAPDPAEVMADRILAATGGAAEGQVAVGAFAEAEVDRLMAALDASGDDALSQEEAEAPRRRHGRMGGPRH